METDDSQLTTRFVPRRERLADCRRGGYDDLGSCNDDDDNDGDSRDAADNYSDSDDCGDDDYISSLSHTRRPVDVPSSATAATTTTRMWYLTTTTITWATTTTSRRTTTTKTGFRGVWMMMGCKVLRLRGVD